MPIQPPYSLDVINRIRAVRGLKPMSPEEMLDRALARAGTTRTERRKLIAGLKRAPLADDHA